VSEREIKSVDLAELKAGVKLRTGRMVVLVVKDLKRETSAPESADDSQREDSALQPKVVARTYLRFEDEDHVDEAPLRLQYVCIGSAEGEGDKARLNVTATGYVDVEGRILETVPEEGKPPPPPLRLPAGGKLFARFHPKAANVDKGPSNIPIALCDPIGADGVVHHRRLLASHPWAFRIIEQKLDKTDDGIALGDLDQGGEAPELLSGELSRALREMAEAASSLRGAE